MFPNHGNKKENRSCFHAVIEIRDTLGKYVYEYPTYDHDFHMVLTTT